jgi:hypothetical protein
MPDGSCIETDPTGCANAGGSYAGDRTNCASVVCTPFPAGACCLSSNTCFETYAAFCISHGGSYTADTGGYTGNTNCSSDGKRNLGDITRLIDRVYVSKTELCCEENGNTNGDVDDKINLGDITKLIDHVYVSKTETATCP